MTFERKVAVRYLAHLLIGDGAVELGDGRSVTSVAFQQAPDHPVDDLVVPAARADELEPSLVLALGVRRAPDLVQSDESTQKLIRDFVRGLIEAPVGGPSHCFALVVAGAQPQAEQLSELAGLAAVQMDAASLFDLVRTPNKFTAAIRARLDQIEALVKQALIDLGSTDPDLALVHQRTWELLSRLTVLMPRLESPDDSDWSSVENSLIGVARGRDLAGASALRDRLVALAAEYAPKAARVNLSLLRRDAHALLDTTTRQNRQGWQALDHLHERARTAVRDDIRATDGDRRIRIDRNELGAGMLTAAANARAVVVHGESGVGKSALAILSAIEASVKDPDTVQVLCVNLRHLPAATVAFEAILGRPLATLLDEMSAPQRMLIVDGADAVAERMFEAFRYLVDAARSSAVKVIAVTATDSKQVVRDTIADAVGADVAECVVPGLTDAQVGELVTTFPELGNLAANARSRELLRRPVVIDLLVRGRISGVPLNDADAMCEVWSGLVRRHERSDRGTPDAREVALLKLADLALAGSDALDLIAEIDPTALDGLRHDGLLRTSTDNPFRIGPEFAHDEVRRYAVARLLLAEGDPVSKLEGAGAPRWALSAARLACQAWLALPGSVAAPLHGRFAALQMGFDAIARAGHGDRWGDVPGEALLTLGDPDPLLRDAWPELRADGAKGLERLARLVDQRLRNKIGIVDIIAVEPIIMLLLEDETPWLLAEYVRDLFRDWLRAHVVADTPAGHPLRIRLRNRLVAACAAADRRLAQEQATNAAARAARSPEEIEEERQRMEKDRALVTEIGYPRSGDHRKGPEVPREITKEIVLELLALLGPDLGDDGEAILRRVAQDAPQWLAPAVEELLTGRALAMYRRGLLAVLTEAYYIDKNTAVHAFHDYGIRSHHARGFGVTPLAAWYRGPFLWLFQTDPRNGIAVLNRMLNHAALVRARVLTNRYDYDDSVDDDAIGAYRNDLEITGSRRAYVGDAHVWVWYRGTGVGPYPCFSALQALERVCDQLLGAGTPLARLVPLLLDGCESLAMVGLVVGLLVRHLTHVDRLLDPYLAEPLIWHHEFNRVVSETNGLAASSEGLAGAERRTWSLREAAMFLTVQADDVRAAELRTIGEQLVVNARRIVVSPSDDDASGEEDVDSAAEEQLAAVRAWASSLHRDCYEAQQVDGGVRVQLAPPDDIVRTLEPGNQDLLRGQEVTRLIVRYHVDPKRGRVNPVGDDDLIRDLASARDLLSEPPRLSPVPPWDAAAAVAATALEAHLLNSAVVPHNLLIFAADTVLRIGNGEATPRQHDDDETYFEQGADRSAARALPLLLLPIAAPLRSLVDGADGSDTYARAFFAGVNFAHAVPNEVRLHLARGLDRVWQVPCSAKGDCHHQLALQLALETMRDCVLGDWDRQIGRRRIVGLGEPVGESLASIPGDAIYFVRLDAAIRALAPAATAHICASSRARDLVRILLAAQRRALLAHKEGMDPRGTRALVSARALLTLAADGHDADLYEHIDAYADNSTLLGSLLRALSAAAEETPERAATARRLWPGVITHVLELNESGRTPFDARHYGDMALAALIPNAAHESSYFYREVLGEPIVWWELLAWESAVKAWLPTAAGIPSCVDHLILFLRAFALDDQVRTGLRWIVNLVLADVASVAGGSFLLSTWLIENRSAAVDAGLLAEWQQVVDALVVAGVRRLAPYSE